MMRLLIRTVLAAVALTVILPHAIHAQNDFGERAGQRAERLRERADRFRQRAERRAEQLQQRIEDRVDRLDGRDGAHIVIAHDYRLSEGSTAGEKVVVFAGNANIEGHAEDDVVVLGGTLRLGPKAVVDGDVSVVGGRLDRDPAAVVRGDVDVAHVSVPEWAWTWPDEWPVSVNRFWWEGAALAFTIGRFVLVLFLSVLLVVVAPRWTASIAGRLSASPGGSLIAGFAGEIFFAPLLVLLTVALVVTIIGIPLLAGIPILIAACALLWVTGYAALAGVLGARLRGVDWHSNGLGVVDVIIGSSVLSSLTLFGQVLIVTGGWLSPLAMLVRGSGWTIEYIAWTVALGAALTAWMRRGGFDTRQVPPVVPPLPTPSPTAS
jgi:hypothetical protein